MSEYTPSTDEVRDVYVRHECYYTDVIASQEDTSAEFDRFIAHIKAKVLREAAVRARWDLGCESGGHTSTYFVRNWLEDKADEIQKEAGR